jgi:rhomboid protease GluP
MAFVFYSKHIQEIPLDNLTSEHFLVIAIDVVRKLQWKISSIFENGFIAYTKIPVRSFNEEVNIRILDKTVELKSESTGIQILDWGKNKENISNFTHSFNEIKNSFTIEELDQKFEELKPLFISKEETILIQPPSAIKEILTGILSVFKPTQGYFITPILINLNIILFIIMVMKGAHIFSPDSQSLILWGANFRPLTLNGQWWRLFTSIFLHLDFFHLLMNTIALFYIGLLLEPRLGKTMLISSYVLTGILASTTSLWWHDLTISAGASGAIIGLYGVLLALLTTNLIEKHLRSALMIITASFVGYNLVLGLQGNTDNAAHIGGLLSGVVIGYSIVPILKRNDDLRSKINYVLFSTAITIALCTLIFKSIIPYQFDKYNSLVERFVVLESMALEMFEMPESTPKEEFLFEIKTRSLYYWNENKKIINEADLLYLPGPIQIRNKKLLEYCELRIKNCQLIYKSIEESTVDYSLKINQTNDQIESILNELSIK